MCPAARQSTTALQEAISEAPRCNIWWHLLIVGGLTFLALVGLCSWSGWLTLRAAEIDRKACVNETKAAAVEKTLDELRADVKELLRRTRPSDRSDLSYRQPPSAHRPPPTEAQP